MGSVGGGGEREELEHFFDVSGDVGVFKGGLRGPEGERTYPC